MLRGLGEKVKNAKQGEVAWDDVTGMPLDAKGVREAREKEMDHVDKKRVWIKIPRAEAIKRGWKIISLRW